MRIVALILLTLALGSNQAAAQSPSAQELDAIVSSRICPANPTRYKRVTYEAGCGPGYYAVSPKMLACTKEIDGINRRLNAYNTFIGQCTREKKAAPTESKNKGGWAQRLKQAESRNQSRNQVDEQSVQELNSQVKRSQERAEKRDAAGAKRLAQEEAARQKQERENARRAKAQYERDLNQLRQRQAQERRKIVEEPSIIGQQNNLPVEFRGKRNYGWCRKIGANLYGLFHKGQRMCVLPTEGGGCYGCNTEQCVAEWCNN